MSEPLLKAILHLFVIVAKEDDIAESERQQVIDFLKEHLNSQNFNTYLEFFDKKGEELLVSTDQDQEEKEIKALCRQINIELTKKQKTVLLKELIELILADGSISEKENELVTQIASLIHIDSQEVEALKQFVLAKDLDDYTFSKTVIFTDQQGKDSEDVIVRNIENLGGNLAFIYLDSSDTYFLKYDGVNEIYLNNVLVNPGQIVIFPGGSSIRAQKFNPIYYSDVVSHFLQPDDKSKISFEANNITFRFKSGDIGLRNITVQENSGKMIGLMGASGAGKSTLLNVLNGTEVPSEGQVLINGLDIHGQKDRIEGVIGHVPQDDLLIEDLTVYQNLFFAAKLCFKDLPETEIGRLIKKTLQKPGIARDKKLACRFTP